MAIFTGAAGHIEVKREGDDDQPFPFVLRPNFVNEDISVFSFDYMTELSPNAGEQIPPFITGDRVQIRSREASLVYLVENAPTKIVEGFIWVNSAGQFRLYRLFDDAINHANFGYLKFQKHSDDQKLSILQVPGKIKCLAQVSSYSFVTERENIDVTTLGDEFRERHTRGLIAGQGTITCFWDYAQRRCEEGTEGNELPHFLAELAQRVKFGAEFLGFFYLHKPDDIDEKFVWQEAKCIVTNVAFEIQPTQPIVTTIQFVTTGGFALRIGFPNFQILVDGTEDPLLTEDLDALLQQMPDD